MKRKLLLINIAFLWFLVVGGGELILLNYDNTPGLSVKAPSEWPSESRINRSHAQPTLIMFVHPECPCSRASAGELELLMARLQGKIATKVLFYKPASVPQQRKETNLLNQIRNIPGVELIEDLNGVEARRFNIFTSGATILYDAEGHLRFNGGITPWRSHSGDNIGRSAIVSIVSDPSLKAHQTETFVFGCPIFPQQKQGGNLS